MLTFILYSLIWRCVLEKQSLKHYKDIKKLFGTSFCSYLLQIQRVGPNYSLSTHIFSSVPVRTYRTANPHFHTKCNASKYRETIGSGIKHWSKFHRRPIFRQGNKHIYIKCKWNFLKYMKSYNSRSCIKKYVPRELSCEKNQCCHINQLPHELKCECD